MLSASSSINFDPRLLNEGSPRLGPLGQGAASPGPLTTGHTGVMAYYGLEECAVEIDSRRSERVCCLAVGTSSGYLLVYDSEGGLRVRQVSKEGSFERRSVCVVGGRNHIDLVRDVVCCERGCAVRGGVL